MATQSQIYQYLGCPRCKNHSLVVRPFQKSPVLVKRFLSTQLICTYKSNMSGINFYMFQVEHHNADSLTCHLHKMTWMLIFTCLIPIEKHGPKVITNYWWPLFDFSLTFNVRAVREETVFSSYSLFHLSFFSHDHELYKVLVNYINDFRPRLAKEDSGDYLLLVTWFKLFIRNWPQQDSTPTLTLMRFIAWAYALF